MKSCQRLNPDDQTANKTALLIGGTGFAGRHMEQNLKPHFKVIATGRASDIKNIHQIRQLIKNASPDLVINFASITTVKESFQNPLDTYNTGFLGTLNLLTVLKENDFKGKMLNISSSEVYGFPSNDLLPIREETSPRPMSPYSVSKIATEALCYQWSQTEAFNIMTARPFTHIGPGQSDKFSISNFAKQIAEIMLKKRKPVIQVGNLDTTRDFTDVRDVTAAYRLILDKGRNGEMYNVCSGEETSLHFLLNELINCANIPIEIKKDASRMRDAEQRRIYGSCEKIKKETGWIPTITLNRTLLDILSYWLEKLKQDSLSCI